MFICYVFLEDLAYHLQVSGHKKIDYCIYIPNFMFLSSQLTTFEVWSFVENIAGLSNGYGI